jgi:hypothetical protein
MEPIAKSTATRTHPTGHAETPSRWLGGFTCTDAIGNTDPHSDVRNATHQTKNTHILGGCRSTSKIRIKRHNNTFLLLHKLLQTSNGGRWPIVGIDLGNKPTMNFTNLKSNMEETTTPQLPQILLPKTRAFKTTNHTYQTIHELYRNISSHTTIDQLTTDRM